MQQPARKPRACVPCHERKVRCDLAEVGTPCTRCTVKDRTPHCVVVARPERRILNDSNKRKTSTNSAESVRRAPNLAANKPSADRLSADRTSADAGREREAHDALMTMARTPTSFESRDAVTENVTSPQAPNRASPLTNSSGQSSNRPSASSHLVDPRPQYSTSEDDGPLQTLCRMADNEAVILSPVSTGKTEQQSRRIFEYYSDFNALTVLNEAIGQQSQRRLVQIDLDEPQSTSVIHRELCRLDAVDRAYLAQRRVHDLPSPTCCDSMLQLFFTHVYPYTPVVDRVQLAYDFSQQNCSSFLLYAIFAITVPYAPSNLVQAMSFESITEAQKAFFTRARVLFDFGCERGQLNLLQGSIFMSSFQNSFAPDKDFRFWFNNAMHMATQMGLHRRNIEQDLDPAIHRVCRRIWWLLFQRDVMFSLAGFENVRHINDDETNTRFLCEDDWVELEVHDAVRTALPVTSKIQVQFMIENCKLAKLGARCVWLIRATDGAPSIDEARKLSEDITLWRRELPSELRMENTWELDEHNIWIIVILTFSYRLECLFYRKLRQRANGTGSDGLVWVNQRLVGAIFELSTLVRRAMAHNILTAGPPAMIVCTTQLMALQIEMALDNDCGKAKKQALKAEIHVILSYLHEIEEKWMNAKWASRVFQWVVRHTGLLLSEPGGLSNPDEGYGNIRGHQGQSHLDPIQYPNLATMEPMEPFPDNWLQDMINHGILGDQDQAMFEILGAPF
ncbi:fungal-specific transcription factor domain-containing protein [Dactylonectria macrodidyma]|uniref:Fungal-specific transcription factor domain-containing protein n=1 Tax=Dactylonectria macrodidyma TaxID=307937 RepID=A0A9P9DWZ3_9HYPO|nr:fungal-specific transcription factor domain-containing protein [Dactylonectria macrodidyma]